MVLLNHFTPKRNQCEWLKKVVIDFVEFSDGDTWFCSYYVYIDHTQCSFQINISQ